MKSESALSLVINNKDVKPVLNDQLKLRAACLVIFKSLDPDAEPDSWEKVKPDDVPAFIRERDTVRALVNGEMCQAESVDAHWYRAEQLVMH